VLGAQQHRHAFDDLDRVGDQFVDRTLGSAMRLTKEELAPFSSRRRTR
jgi:hypothetical protein